MSEKIVIALGGNASSVREMSSPTADAQLEVVRETSEKIARDKPERI